MNYKWYFPDKQQADSFIDGIYFCASQLINPELRIKAGSILLEYDASNKQWRVEVKRDKHLWETI